MTKSHPHQWTIRDEIIHPDSEIVEQFRAYPTTQVADSGEALSVMGPGIRWLAGGSEICGTATTLWTKPGDVLYTLKSPDLVHEGDVLVVDGGGREDAAVVGDILSSCLVKLGCRGVIVDGAVRDLDGINELGLPVFARNSYPTTGSMTGPGAINVPIQCGGVTVNPGDIVRADSSGVVVVPKDRAEATLAATKVVSEREAGWRKALAGGSSLPTAVGGVDEQIAAVGNSAQP